MVNNYENKLVTTQRKNGNIKKKHKTNRSSSHYRNQTKDLLIRKVNKKALLI